MNVRERRLSIMVASLVGLIVAWRLVANPVVEKVGELRGRAAAARAAIEAEAMLAERAETVKAKDAQLFKAKDLSDVGTVEADFLKLVDNAARDAGVKVSSERPSNNVHHSTKARGEYAELQVALTGEGTLEAFALFLKTLAAGERPLRVVAASLSRTDRAGLVAVNMRLSTVALKEAAK